MNKWLEILDHGDDPCRYTVIRGDGRIAGCNANGTIVFQRRCKRPNSLVHALRREPGVGIVPPKQVAELLKKFALPDLYKTPKRLLTEEQRRAIPFPEEYKNRLLAYAKRQCPHADYFSTRVSWQGNYVVTTGNDYPLQHGDGFEWTFTPEQIELLPLL